MLLLIMGYLLFVHFVAWLTRHFSHCCTEICIILDFFAFLGFIFSCVTLFIFTQSSWLAIDPVLRVLITVYLSMQLYNIHFLRHWSSSVRMVLQ